MKDEILHSEIVMVDGIEYLVEEINEDHKWTLLGGEVRVDRYPTWYVNGLKSSRFIKQYWMVEKLSTGDEVLVSFRGQEYRGEITRATKTTFDVTYTVGGKVDTKKFSHRGREWGESGNYRRYTWTISPYTPEAWAYLQVVNKVAKEQEAVKEQARIYKQELFGLLQRHDLDLDQLSRMIEVAKEKDA